MIRIYSWDTTDFETNGNAALLNAYDVCIERNINGESTLSFKLPPTDKNWSYVTEEAIVKVEGQCYRIKTINERKVTAYPIYQDASGHHLQSIGGFFGTSGYSILQSIFEKVANIKVLSPQEVYGLSFEPICGTTGKEDLIDFFEQSKITPIGALKYLQEQLSKNNIHSELYFDNYNIALVKKLGSDKGARIDLRHNATSIKPKKDTTELVTKLYPYGSGDIHIGSVTKAGYYDAKGTIVTDKNAIEEGNYCYRILKNNDQFIVSPYADKYPMHEGYMSFTDIDEPDKLLAMAAKQFENSNPERIDVPKYTLEIGELAQIGIPIALGDIVEVNDPQFNIKTKQRVVSEKRYPFEPEKNSVTVGSPDVTILEMFGGAITKTLSMISSDGKVKSSWLESIKGSYRTTINRAFGDATKMGRSAVIHDYGDIWVNPNEPNQALAIIGGRLAIANGKTEDGDWDWKAFGDWSGFTADKLIGGTIYTELVRLMGDGAKLTIEDNMITFKEEVVVEDGSKKELVRARWGYKGKQYIFEMKDNNGDNTVSITSTGNIRIKGDIRAGSLDTTVLEDGACGYLIDGASILGMKYMDSEEDWVDHGLSVWTDEETQRTAVNLCVNGTEHLMIEAKNDPDSDARIVDFCVNNTAKNGDEDYTAWTFLRAQESSGKVGDGPKVIIAGDWDVGDKYLNFVNGAKNSTAQVDEGKHAFTGRMYVKLSQSGQEYGRWFHFVNGILMGLSENTYDWV